MSETVGAITMPGLLSSVSQVFTAALGWMTDVANTVASEPLLLVGVIIPIACVGIGMFRRLVR